MSFQSEINDLNTAALRFSKYGHCPYLSIPRLTTSAPLLRLSEGRSKFISFLIFFVYFTYSAFQSLFIQLLGSIYVSFLRLSEPPALKKTFPFLFSTNNFLSFHSPDHIIFEPYLGQSDHSFYHFKYLFSHFICHSIDHTRIFLVDSPFKIHTLRDLITSHQYYFPFFLGFKEYLFSFCSQLFFAFRLTLFLLTTRPSLLFLWFSLLPSVFTNWSFSLFAVKHTQSLFNKFQDNKNINIHLLHEGFVRDLLFYKHLSVFPFLHFSFYCHTPLLSSSNTLISNIIFNPRSNYFFEDPLAICSVFYKQLINTPSLDLNCINDPYLDIPCNILSIHSSQFVFHRSPLSSFSFSLSSFIDKSSQQNQLPFVILPQGFISETYCMIDFFLEAFNSNPFFKSIFKPYISLHPTLRNNLILKNYIHDNNIIILTDSGTLSSSYKLILCGESTSGYSYLDLFSLPLAFESGSFTDSVFSRLHLNPLQIISSSLDLTELFILFAHD